MVDLSFLYVRENFFYIIARFGCMGSDHIFYCRSGKKCPLLWGKKVMRLSVLSAIHGMSVFVKGVPNYWL